MMIGSALATLRALIGGNGLLLGAIAGLAVTGLLWDRGRITAAEQRGAQEVQRVIERKGAKDVEKAREARARVGGAAADCLRDAYCRRD